MKKLLFFVLLFNRLIFASYAHNWTGLGDTLSITDTLDSLEVHYTEAYELSPYYEDLYVICKANDTGTASFNNDSLFFEWGYEVGYICLDSSGDEDTLWDDRITVDTMCADSFGTANVETQGTDGDFDQTLLNDVDTSDVSGFACQVRRIQPPWGILIRFYASGLGNAGAAGARQRDDQPLELWFDVKRRYFVPMRSQ